MCINFNGYHSGGSTFVNVNDCWLLQKLFVYHIYKFSLEKEKKNKESQYMVSHPENGSDSPIGSDRDRGRDRSGAGGPQAASEVEATCGRVRVML